MELCEEEKGGKREEMNDVWAQNSGRTDRGIDRGGENKERTRFRTTYYKKRVRRR